MRWEWVAMFAGASAGLTVGYLLRQRLDPPPLEAQAIATTLVTIALGLWITDRLTRRHR
jgi:nanoRNase/pAp phosphatase (c-di-AMP/oligoRNAs hydrolase)